MPSGIILIGHPSALATAAPGFSNRGPGRYANERIVFFKNSIIGPIGTEPGRGISLARRPLRPNPVEERRDRPRLSLMSRKSRLRVFKKGASSV